jgi:O-acetyl-ADP-ribose deacetylase (regulator of RNase III)
VNPDIGSLKISPATIETMIKFTQGDILKSEDDFIAQGVAVGLQEGLGTGLALKISQHFPENQKEFKKKCRNFGFKAGEIVVTKVKDQKTGIIYIATQPDMYHADITFLNKGLRNLLKYCTKNNVVSVSVPKISSGLGKLDWKTQVKPLMIQTFSEALTIFTVYEYYLLDHSESNQ